MFAILQSDNTVDAILGVLIAIFILSVITEKITSLIRKYPRQCQIISLFGAVYLVVVSVASCIGHNTRIEYLVTGILFLSVAIFSINSIYRNLFKKQYKNKAFQVSTLTNFNPLKNIAHKTEESADDETTTKEVTLLSFLVGLGVAFAFKADMMAVFKGGDEIAYGVWDQPLITEGIYFNEALCFSPSVFFGILTTGFFLSFGSKFFHDLIDTLLQAKNLKRKANSRADLEIQDIQDFDDFIQIDNLDIARLAIEQNRAVLLARFPHILYLSETVAHVSGHDKVVVAIYLDNDDTAGLPTFLPATRPSGLKVRVPTEIVAGVGMGRPTGGIKSKIADDDSPSFFGSACCLLKDKDDRTLLLTNYHVKTEGDAQPIFQSSEGPVVLGNDDPIGHWIYGSIDRRGDFALVRLEEPDDFRATHGNLTFTDQRKITEKDYGKTKLNVKGSLADTTGWVVDSLKNTVGITYNNGISVVFDEAILLGNQSDKQSSRPVTEEHDSGGAVYDDKDNLVGIITGANQRFTIVIPVSSFITQQKLTLL